MVGSKGQQWTVFQLLQGGIIAMVMLTIVYGVVMSVQDRIPVSDTYSISCGLLSSAYNARGSGKPFVREARLTSQEFTSYALIKCSGLPTSGVSVNLLCTKAFCLYNGRPLDVGRECRRNSPCTSMELLAGDIIPVCAVCYLEDECELWFGESEC